VEVNTIACKRPFSLGCVAHTDGAVFQAEASREEAEAAEAEAEAAAQRELQEGKPNA
jgi:hypothetical protein